MPANLIHPIWVTITPWNSAGQQQDAAAREPIHGARSGTPVKIQAQVKWSARSQPSYGAGGTSRKSDGYILLRRADMRAKKLFPKRGDKITSFGVGPNALNSPADQVYITGEEPMAHYPASGGSELAKFHFENRDPGRQP